MPSVFPAQVDGEQPAAAFLPDAGSGNSAVGPAGGNDSLPPHGPPVADLGVGPLAGKPIVSSVATEAPKAIPATTALGRAGVVAVPASVDRVVVPAADAARQRDRDGVPASLVGTGSMRADAAVATQVHTRNAASVAGPELSGVDNRLPQPARTSVQAADLGGLVAQPAPATIGSLPASPAPAETDGTSPAPLVVAKEMPTLPAPSVADFGVRAEASVPSIETPAPTLSPSRSDIGTSHTPALPDVGIQSGPTPSAMVGEMPDTVAIQAAAGNGLSASPPASPQATVAAELLAGVQASEPPTVLRRPALVSPSEAVGLTVASLDQDRRPVEIPAKGAPDLTPARAGPPPSSSPEAPPTAYQPLPWSPAPAPGAAELVSLTHRTKKPTSSR